MAEMEVCKELCEVSNVVIEDLRKVGGDENGDVNGVGDDKEEKVEKEVGDSNLSLNGNDDPDGSYVFISRSYSANADLIDRDLDVECVQKSPTVSESELGSLDNGVEGQAGDLHDQNGVVVYNCVAEGTDAIPDGLMVEPHVAGDDVLVQAKPEVVESDHGELNGEAKIEEEIPTVVSEVGHGAPRLDDGEIESEDQTNLNSTKELGAVCESQDLEPELGDLGGGEEKPEENNDTADAIVTESEEAPDVLSEASEPESSLLNDGKLKSKDSASIELPIVLEGTQESEVVVPEAAECESPDVLLEPSESDERADIELPIVVEGSEESQVLVLEAAECELPEVGVTEVIAEKETKLESPQEAKEILESENMMPESAEPEYYQLDEEKQLGEENETDSGLIVKENQESQLLVSDNHTSGVDEGNKVEGPVNETVVKLDSETTKERVLDENKDICPTFHVEDSIMQAEVHGELIDTSQNKNELNGSENTECFPSPADCKASELEIGSEPVESIVHCTAKDANSEIEVRNDSVGGDLMTSCDEVSSRPDIELPYVKPDEGKVHTLSSPDVIVESEVSNKVIDCACIEPLAVNGSDPECLSTDSLKNGSDADMVSVAQVENCPPISGSNVPCNDTSVSSKGLESSDVNSSSAPNCVPEGSLNVQDDGDQVDGGDNCGNLPCQGNDSARVSSDEISTPLLEGSSSDTSNDQIAGAEDLKRPYYFLIRIPKYDDENLKEQIRNAQLQVDEKTRQRDAIRVDMQMIRDNRQHLDNKYEVARSEARAARRLVKLKRQEIESVQAMITRVKNAISVEDIDVRINNMEHMMQHETLSLKEEKQFIRELKQAKHLREEISSNMGSQDEVQQALDQRDQIEQRLKILKKELDSLKEKASKAEATVEGAEKKCSEECKKLDEFNAQFKAADKIRQEAYSHLKDLKKQLFEKNDRNRVYKDDSSVAYNYASRRENLALHHHCINQVETIMELWNKDDEFQKEYLRCNTRSTLRRFRTSDGRALGPDEEPTVLPRVVYERIDRYLSTPEKGNTKLQTSTLEQDKPASSMAGQETDGKSMAKVAEQTDQTAKTNKPGKHTLKTGSITFPSRDETEEVSGEECKPTKEEQELARKEEELLKEEAAAKLKEQLKLEEKVKAQEASERKKRNTEKNRIRAELKAQKEAEQKEKEKEKKAKKKERKKAAGGDALDGSNDGETVLASELPVGTNKEPAMEESPSTTKKRPQKPSQFTKQSKAKSIPPPLRNRGKRKMQQWIWVILTAVVVLALFLLGNIGFYSNLGNNLRMRNYGL